MQTILFWILAFITGFSQENTAFVTGSFIIVLVLTNMKYLLKLPLKEKIYWILSILIFGIGAKMFYVAGPVLVNGVAYSIIVGLVYSLIMLF